MPILVNGQPREWTAGLTVSMLLEEMKFSFPLKTVFVNGKRIPKSEHSRKTLSDGDKIEVIHMMSGG